MKTKNDIPDFAAIGLDPTFIGSSTDEWLEEEGFAEEIHKEAIKELRMEKDKK